MGNIESMELEVAHQVLENWNSSEDTLDNLVQKTILANRQSYEKNIAYFGIVGSNAPFVGLLGTVIGVIISFKELGDNPKGGLEVVGPGISEALVATAVGLLVAIPAVVMFNFSKGRLATCSSDTFFPSKCDEDTKEQRNMAGGLNLDDDDGIVDINIHLLLMSCWYFS